MNLNFFTIGVYGTSESEFFRKLIENRIDTFCDIRLRRAVRGAQYAFVNSKRLQQKLGDLSINYRYEVGLAPTHEVKKLQEAEDVALHVQRRKRQELGNRFKAAYRDAVLSKFNMDDFISELSREGARNVVLFCVEKAPAACHRSLVTEKIAKTSPKTAIVHL